MDSLQVLYITLSVAAGVFVVVFGIISFIFIKILLTVKRILEDIEDTTEGIQTNVEMLKSGLQAGILSIIGKALGIEKVGDKSDKEK